MFDLNATPERAMVRDRLNRRLDPRTRAPLAVALSGGGDSMALLLVAAAWAQECGRPLLALTVDHGLHPKSGAWTAFAGAAARALMAEWRPLGWAGPAPGAGLPAAARAARHALLARAAREAGAPVVLFGHTADDAAEADWMRVHVAPGIGRLKEWGPSPSWPDGRGVYALRPLLGVRRATLRAWLAAEARPWLEDPSNQDLRFGRSRARAALAADPDIRPPPPEETPGAPSDLPSQEALDGALVLERRRLRDGGSNAVRLLGVAAACASGSPAPPRRAQLERLAARLAGPGAVIASLCGARIVASEDAVAVSREPGEHRRRPLEALTLRAGEVGVWDGRFEIAAEADLTVRPAAGSLRRLAAADRAALAAVPSDRRGALPLIGVGGRVLPPRPFGPGPAFARALSGARFAAALGAASHERDIARIFMANERQSSYVEDLALA